MTHDDSRVHVGIGASERTDRTPVEVRDASVRVLILGNFSGHRDDRPPLARRTIWRVDRDGIDAAIAGIAPELRLVTDPAAGAELIAIRELDDFHPDNLLGHVPGLVRLRAVRDEIEARPPGARRDPPPPRTDTPDSAVGTGSLLDRILDELPLPPAGHAIGAERGTETGDALAELIGRAVRPHMVSEMGAEQHELIGRVDDVLVATLRVLLHEPEFSALEALWRGVDFFVRRCDADAAIQIDVLDLGKSELATLTAVDTDGKAVRADRLPLHDGVSSESRWSLVIAAHSVGPGDVRLLRGIADLAGAMRTPWVAAADPELAGATSFADGADVDDWQATASPEWNELRASPNARWLALALPRFLLRLPYGAHSDPIETLAFEEVEEGAVLHETYLWGNPAFLVGLVASEGQAPSETPASHGTIGGLPVHTWRADGVAQATPCAEAFLPQRALMHLLDRGLTPLASARDADAVRMPRIQSIASPPTPLAVRPIGDH